MVELFRNDVSQGVFASVQAAVDAAQDGDRIVVGAGTYVEQVVVNNKDDLSIEAAPGADVTIQAPADVVETARSISGREIHGVFTVIDSANVTLTGIDIDGAGAGNTVDEGTGSGQANFYGVFYRNSSGGLADVDVRHIRDSVFNGTQRGIGVGTDNATQLAFSMIGGSISDFQKNSTVFNGAILNISGVVITGAGATSVIAQNGIQVTNSTGSISGNTISGFGYTGGGTTATAVLGFGNVDLDITGNTISGTATTAAAVVGIYILDFGTPNSGGSISGNMIDFVDRGIVVRGDLTPDGIVVENNDIDNIDGTDPSAAGVDFQPDPAFATDYAIEGTGDDDVLVGGAGNDSLSGLGGNDSLTGGAGNDTLAGDDGTDTANYGGAPSGYTVATVANSAGLVTAFTGVADTDAGNGNDGADSLTGVERLAFTGLTLNLADPVQLFDAGNQLVATFATIQAAINAASANYAIRVAAGTYNEVINVNKDVTIEGPNVGKAGSDITRGAEAVIKGAYISAEGATLNGLKVAYDGTLVAGNPTGVLVANDGVTLTNLVIDGIDQAASTGIVTPFNGGVTGLAISNNLITDFFQGAYLNPTTGFTATGNTFTSNVAVDLAGDDWAAGTQIGGNNFPDSITHIGYSTNQTNFDFDQFLTGAPNTFGGTGRAISVTGRGDGDAGGQNLHGTAHNDSLSDSSMAPSGIDGTLDGEGGDDRLTGNAGNDTLTGGTGNDTLRGGSGTDTATYADSLTVANIAAVADGDPTLGGNQPGWTVTTATEGTDNLTGVEIVDGAEAGKFLLVGSGGFTTIQAAVDAASDGDTILVAAGTYVENVTVNKDVAIRGPNAGTPGHGPRVGEAVVDGGFYMHAAGATLDGLTVLGGGVLAGNPAGIYVDTDDVTLTNLVIQGDGTAGGGIVTPSGGGVTGLTLSNSRIDDWANGTYFNPTTGFTASGNSFDGNGVALTGDDWEDGTLISNNIFTNSSFGHVGYGVFDSVDDVGAYFGPGNSFDPSGGRIGIFAYGDGTPGGQDITGTGFGDYMAAAEYVAGSGNGATFRGEGGDDYIDAGDGDDTLDGGAGTDTMVGGAGNDAYVVDSAADVVTEGASAGTDEIRTGLSSYSLAALPNVENLTGLGNVDQALTGNDADNVIAGGAGNDAIEGGNGVDTARYAGTATITENATGWTVLDGTGGTDTLSNVEIVDDNDSGKTLLVGNGGYATIQEAIDAASNGDTILVSSGTYVENPNVNKDVTILGANHGVNGTAARGLESVIDGQIVVNAAGATVDGFRLVGDAAGPLGTTAVHVKADDFTLTNSVLDGDGNFAFFVGLVSDVEISRNLIAGYAVGAYVAGGNTSGSINDNRFQGDLGPLEGMANGVNSESSHVAIANNVFDGLYDSSLTLFPFGPDTVDLQTYVTGNTISNTPVARPVQIYPTDLTHNILGTNFNEAFIGDYGVTGPLSYDGRGGDDRAWGGEQGDTLSGGTGNDQLFGNGGADTLSGGDNNDIVTGGAGNDVLAGGTGVDTLNGGNDNDSVDGGSGNDTLNGDDGNDMLHGGAGNDALNGGNGTDTAVYDGHRGDYSIGMITGPGGRVVGFSSVSDNEPSNGNEGFDSFTSVEAVQFTNRTLDATLPVQLFDQANQLIGTFTTIQAAINTAQDNYTIRVAAGVFDEDLIVNVGVRILGARQTAVTNPSRDAANGVGETTIIGHAKVTAEDNVTFTGIRFLNDSTTTGGGASNPTLQFLTGGGFAGHLVSNSIFWSTVVGGADGVEDRAISSVAIPDGQLNLSGNLISGTQQGLFDTASWGRGIWFDGGGASLTVSGNIIEWTRTGLTLDGAGGSLLVIDSNNLRNVGTAFSVVSTENDLNAFGNDFENVGTEFNFRNITESVTFNAGAAFDTLNTVGSPNDLVVILGGSGDDVLTGSVHDDVIDGNNSPTNPNAADSDVLNGGGGNDQLYGRGGNDRLNGQAGNDALDGGAGIDTAVVASDATYVANGATWTVTSSDGVDTLTSVERVDVSVGPGSDILLVGSGGFATIQAAVNAANDGDIILVAAGTYVEQVVVNGRDNLTIRPTDGALVTIKAPTDVIQTATRGSGQGVEAVLTAIDSANLTIDGITIDGAGAGNSVTPGNEFSGIYFRDSSGSLLGVHVAHVRDAYVDTTPLGDDAMGGAQRGRAVLVDNPAGQLAFTMTGGSISDFQKNGLVVNNADVDISGVAITGGNVQQIAQNGIVISNSTGTIDDNTITAVGTSTTSSAATGILGIGGNVGLAITNNTISGTNGADPLSVTYGVEMQQIGFGPNSGGQITGNIIDHVDEGVGAYDGFSPDAIAISGNIVTDLDTSNDPNARGVYFDVDPANSAAFTVGGTALQDLFSGGAGADHLTGLGGNDDFTGNGGNDVLAGDGGTDTAHYAGARSGYNIVTVTDASGHVIGYSSVTDTDTATLDEGADTLTSIEKLQFADGTLDLAHPVQLFDAGGQLVGTFGTIQAAINAASNGYSISAAAGTYNEVINVNKDVTITGPNVGKSGTDVTRGAEAVIKGAYMSADGATLDGLKVAYDGTFVAGNPTAILVDRDNVTVTNLVIDGIDQSLSTGIVTTYNAGASGLAISNNLITNFAWGAYLNPTTGFTATGNTFTSNNNSDIAGDDWQVGTQIGGNNFPDVIITHIGYSTNQTNFDFDQFLTGAPNTFGGNGRAISVTGRGDGDAGGQTLHGTAYNDDLDDISAAPSGIDASLDGEGGDDRLTGNAGNDTLIGGAGNDILRGGAGTDTATYADPITLANLAPISDGDPTVGGAQPGWFVLTATEGTDRLTGVEIVDGAGAGRFLLVGSGGFATIQAAIDASISGDTIVIADGAYGEQLTVLNKTNLTITARNAGQVTVHSPEVLAVNGTSDRFDDPVRAVIGVVDSTGISIKGIVVDGGFSGDTTPGSNGDELTGIAYLDSSGSIDDVDVRNVSNSPGGGLFGLQHGSGILIDATDSPSPPVVSVTNSSVADFQKTGVLIFGVAIIFTDNTVSGIGGTNLTAQNGIQIADSTGTIGDNVLDGFGYSGGGVYSSGIIAYEPSGPLAITGNTITGAGAAGSAAGLDLSDVEGVAVQVTDNIFSDLDYGLYAYTFTGGTVGLDVDPNISGNTFSNILVEGIHFAPEESYGAPFTTNSDFNQDGTQFADHLGGSLGDDMFNGLAGDDTLTGNGGNDTLDGGSGVDTAIYSGPVTLTQSGANWTVTGEGTDTLKNIEIVDNANGSNILLVGNGGYATIQAAIDAASNGDTILVAAGTYVENVDVNKDVTILGPNHGKAGTDSTRGAEATIDGQVTISVAGVTIDGVEIVGAAPGPFVGQNYGIVVEMNNFTLVNSVLDGLEHTTGIYVGMVFNLDVSNNLITGYTAGIAVFSGNTTGSIHDNMFQGDGGPATGLHTGLYSQSTHVLIDHNEFDGISGNSLVLVPNGVSGTVDLEDYVTDNTITDSGVPQPVKIYPSPVFDFLGTEHNDDFAGEDNSDFIFDPLSFDGRGGDDLITGAEQGDSFAGGSGTDVIRGNGGDDILTGDSGNDSLNGGDGFDTATYAGPVSDYTITYTTDSSGRVTSFSSVVDDVPAGGDEGSDTLISIEALSFGGSVLDLEDPVQLFDENDGLVGTFGSLQEAIDAAQDDYTIRAAAGSYDEDLVIDVGVTILGAGAGEVVAGRDAAGGVGETNIVGHAQVTAADNVTIDGIRFLNDTTTTAPTLQFLSGGGATGHLVTNSIFWSSITGGGVDDRAISTVVIADGLITITDNLISGTAHSQFSGASWGRAIWFDGGGADLVVTGNTIEWTRSGLNLDMSGDSTADVSNNSFHGVGTGISVGLDAVGLTVADNDIERVNEEFNFRNLTGGVTFNADTAVGVLTPVGDFNDPIVVLGGSGNDNFTGTAGVDVLDGNNSPTDPNAADADVLNGGGGNDFLFGRGGNDMLDGGTGDDALTGGTGNDIYVVDAAGDTVTEAAGEGTDEVRTQLAGYTLAAALENLTGLGSVDQILNGNASDNVIDGGLGADSMTGGAGNDTYVVDHGGDTVTELADEGTDEIRTNLASYTLAALPNVENLTGTNAAGQTLAGNGANNVVIGAAGNDIIDGAAGNDTFQGGAGNDLYFVDSASDSVVELAGEGTDEVRTGIAAYTLTANVENLTATSNINHDFRGNAGDNALSGGGGNDFLRLYDGGNDSAYGGAGNDVILFGAAMTWTDFVDGGDGLDQLVLQGNYVGGSALLFGGGVVSIENIAILPGNDTRFGDPGTNHYDYSLTLQDATVAAGVQLVVDANRLRAGEDFTFDGSAESDGSFFIYGGGGSDILFGGGKNDVFLFSAQGQWNPADVVVGGSGIDQLALRGNYSLTFGAGQLFGIENIGLLSAHDTRFGALGSSYSYDLTMVDENVASGVQMTVDGAKLRVAEFFRFDGSAELDGSFRVFGGLVDDTIIGSRNNDFLQGNGGLDTLTGGLGADIFRYLSASDSALGSADKILDFTPGTDKIDLSRIDANSHAAGDQAFAWIGSNAFTGSGAASAGELRAYQSGQSWFVEGDTDGNGSADFRIDLTLVGPTPLSAGDFVL
jgi:Ca2+-binding RTX toxin-like protein